MPSSGDAVNSGGVATPAALAVRRALFDPASTGALIPAIATTTAATRIFIG